MSDRTYTALFLCTGNSARSILGEAILNRLGRGRFRAHSAGSHPTGRVHPLALETLRDQGHDVAGLRSKCWDEFDGDSEANGEKEKTPAFDLIFTVCDNAAAEACPVWPGNPMTVHWGLPDPAAIAGAEEGQRDGFRETYAELERRIELLVALPIETLSAAELAHQLEKIGRA